MKDIRILIADDDKEIRNLLKIYLERELYMVDTAINGDEALQLFNQNNYNLVILDLMMPKVDGIEVCRKLRDKTNVPILMLTAKDHEVDKILGLSIGADDYITKPFSIHEVIARVKALMRRFLVLGSDANIQKKTTLTFKGLLIDLNTYTVHTNKEEINLTGKELELLKFFTSNPGQVFTKTQLFRNVWDDNYIEDDNTVMVHIRKLRKKIEIDPSNPKFIQTVWGIGYKFVGESLKIDKILFLISLQLIIYGLLNIQMDPKVKISLFITLILITMYLFFSRIQFIQHRKSIDTKLSRVLKGNLQARLFTSNDRSLHNIVFSINELIAELEKVRIEAKRSEESRKKLLSSISHDIRTPLTSIIGYIDALKDEVAASEIEKQEYLKILHMKSNNLKHLVDEIFNMAKLDANEFPLKEEELDFSEVTREVLIEFLPELSKHNIELQILIPESTFPIMADQLSLIRIIGNLMKNAIYYGKDGKTVGVELLETDTEYELLIWDKGPGIPKHDLQNIFERMYRSEQSRNSSFGGSGLGLSISKALVEKNGGHIWVESNPWERTTFGFSIPKHNTFKK